jgi:hypothetical protein
MTLDQVLAIIESISGAAAFGTVFHLLGWAAKPWGRVVLSILPDVIGLIRRAKGLAGAPGAPNVPPPAGPAAAIALLVFATSGAAACSHPKPLPSQDIAICLAQFNGELAGQVSCDAIIRSIAAVLSRDAKCSELLLHGLRCEQGPKDGGHDGV